MRGLAVAALASALLVIACDGQVPDAERDGCAYLHFMASAVTTALDGASVVDFDQAHAAYSNLKVADPPGSLVRADDEDSRNLLEFVRHYRATAIEALDAIRQEQKANVSELQAGARHVWDGRECGDSTGYERWDRVE